MIGAGTIFKWLVLIKRNWSFKSAPDYFRTIKLNFQMVGSEKKKYKNFQEHPPQRGTVQRSPPAIPGMSLQNFSLSLPVYTSQCQCEVFWLFVYPFQVNPHPRLSLLNLSLYIHQEDRYSDPHNIGIFLDIGCFYCYFHMFKKFQLN